MDMKESGMSEILRYARWQDVPSASWPWRNFSPEEIASKGDGSIMVSHHSMDCLQNLRRRMGVPLIITSGYRDPAHNRRVRGVPDSQHLISTAFDIRVDNVDPAHLIEQARAAGFTSFGTYPKQGFVHCDTRPAAEAASWGKPFPPRDGRFAPEPVARPKTQVAKEGSVVVLALAGADQIVTQAAPFLPPEWVSGAMAAIAVVSLGVVLWRAFGRGGAS
jgi:zinc D-Ala-D-Ala carboxypeptidase